MAPSFRQKKIQRNTKADADQKIYMLMNWYNLWLLYRAIDSFCRGFLEPFIWKETIIILPPLSLFEMPVNMDEASNWFYLSNLLSLLGGVFSSAPGANAPVFFLICRHTLAPPNGGCTNPHQPDSSYTHTLSRENPTADSMPDSALSCLPAM